MFVAPNSHADACTAQRAGGGGPLRRAAVESRFSCPARKR